jgi:hypothetical protein
MPANGDIWGGIVAKYRINAIIYEGKVLSEK